jgi:rubrerythrin
MDKFESFEDIIDFAISGETEAVIFYRGLAKKVDEKWMKAVFEDFAKEEEGHRRKLEAIKAGHSFPETKKAIVDLKIGDYLVDVDPDENENLGYQEALIIAMKKEKAAFKLYSDLARGTDNEEWKQVFLSLAQEEAKHKLRFEVEYDDVVFEEN